jgi:hypothetical protein
MMTINGRGLSALGATAAALSGWLDGPSSQRQATALPGVLGAIPATLATTPPRELTLTLRVAATSLTERAERLATLQDALAGLLIVRFSDTPDRFLRCVAGPLTVASIDPAHSMTTAAASLSVSVTLICYDAASYDGEPRILALSTAPVAVPLGTLPSVGVIRWQGAWAVSTARTLTYRGASGIAYGALTITTPSGDSLASGDHLEIDLARRYLTKVTAAGVRTNVYAWLTSGDWFAFDPADGDRAAARWPTLTLSAGSGTLLYRRAWAL